MRTCIKLILGTFVLFGLHSCANSKNVRQGAPVAFLYPFYTVVEAEGSDGVSKLELFLPIDSKIRPSTELDSVYFRGRMTKLELLSENPEILIGRFSMQALIPKEDRIMSADPREEYGNKPPVVLQDFPFDLEPSQAMVSYHEGGETKYFKVDGIEER